MGNEEKEKVALYIRVSTMEQANDGFGLDAQKKKLELYCELKDYDVYKLYCDAGISGKDTKHRKDFNKMIADMRNKKISRIVTLKIDRISRSVADFALLLQDLELHNCKIDFVNEPIDVSGISGKMMAGILSVFAQFERELIVERTTSGMEEAAHSGHFGGKTPLGYMREVVNGEKGKKWVVNEEEAKVVKEIFDLCLKGKTYVQIAEIMKEKYSDLVAYVRENKETGEIKTIYRNWTDGSICVILNNRTYLGIREFRKRVKGKDVIEITGKIPQLITEDTFNECRENINKNKRNYYRDKYYLFMQKLVCTECGRIMACSGTKKKTGQTYLYYKCKDCKTYFREDLIETALMENLADLLELYLILEDNYIVIDSDLAEELNNGKVDNTIRYAMDTVAINKKLDNINYNLLKYLWKLTSYEVKCKFVYEYIDFIKVKQYIKKKGTVKKQNKVMYKGKEIVTASKQHTLKDEVVTEILDLKLKGHKIKQLFEMRESNMLDDMTTNFSDMSFRHCEFKSRKEADKYIETLSKKHNIKVTDVTDNKDYCFNSNLFRVIKINSKRAVEKNSVLHLEVVTNEKIEVVTY